MSSKITHGLALLVATMTMHAQSHSKLWGQSGELWVGEAKEHLRDFTEVGYKKGEVSLPNWPIGVSVTDFGAIPNDGIDDSASFVEAIGKCPKFHAVHVPKGEWVVEKPILVAKDGVVVRGEAMHGTILFMPQYTSVLPDADQFTSWFTLRGDEVGVENLTFRFKPEKKVSHWDGMKGGAHPLLVNATNSWVRNVCILNGDNALTVHGGHHNTLVNIILDHELGRTSPKGYAGHFGIAMKDTEKNLAHNIIISGRWHHALCTLGRADHNVWSQARMENGEIDHHSAGGRFQLYTDIDAGEGDFLFEQDMSVHKPETYWNLKSERRDWPYGYNRGERRTEDLKATIVAMQTSDPSDNKMSNDHWYESIDPRKIEPQNIYMAQLERVGKPLPDDPMPERPSTPTGDALIIKTVADCTVQGGGSRDKASGRGKLIIKRASSENATREVFMKFDLAGVKPSDVGEAQLRVYAEKGEAMSVEVLAVTDDSWAEQELTWNTKPDAIAEGAVSTVVTARQWTEFDLTDLVRKESSGDRVLSIKLLSPRKGGGVVLSSREGGFTPHLVMTPDQAQR